MCKCLYTVTYKNLLLKSLLFLFINTSSEADYSRNRIVIVNSWFLERPQKRSRRNQLIHRRLTKTKSIGSGQDPKSQAGRQSDGYGGWCLELRRGGRHVENVQLPVFFRGKNSILRQDISDDFFLVIDRILFVFYLSLLFEIVYITYITLFLSNNLHLAFLKNS